ncbi:MAG TPA: hypothetical protein IAC72_01135 [Candidatus Fimimonas merdipullorum]|uniref:Uncharacterized protein n=1 Tax=Candidatus Fimimonas merdipullorum TaxID=2840822 RepID=A0A9D1MWK0_9BACT|nr:hypothetical protein [Candidatus Fimimonas merdipullorum]
MTEPLSNAALLQFVPASSNDPVLKTAVDKIFRSTPSVRGNYRKGCLPLQFTDISADVGSCDKATGVLFGIFCNCVLPQLFTSVALDGTIHPKRKTARSFPRCF